MDSITFQKFRAYILVGAICLLFPLLLLAVLISKIYQFLFTQPKSKNISGDIAVVTGGALGLGKEIAIELAKKGCHVAIADVQQEEAEKTAKLLRDSFNVKSKAYVVDVSDYKQVFALNEKISNDLGKATILINNAGILMLKNFPKPEWQDIQQLINVNLTSHFWTNRTFLPNMKEAKKGHIVAISSVSSLFPLIFNAEYTSTKCAVRGLMQVLRQELDFAGYDNIKATTIIPNFLQTNAKVVGLVKKAGYDQLYPLISGEEAAQRVVKGMLQNEEEVVIPACFGILYRLKEFLPASWQNWVLLGPSNYDAFRNKIKKSQINKKHNLVN